MSIEHTNLMDNLDAQLEANALLGLKKSNPNRTLNEISCWLDEMKQEDNIRYCKMIDRYETLRNVNIITKFLESEV